ELGLFQNKLGINSCRARLLRREPLALGSFFWSTVRTEAPYWSVLVEATFLWEFVLRVNLYKLKAVKNRLKTFTIDSMRTSSVFYPFSFLFSGTKAFRYRSNI